MIKKFFQILWNIFRPFVKFATVCAASLFVAILAFLLFAFLEKTFPAQRDLVGAIGGGAVLFSGFLVFLYVYFRPNAVNKRLQEKQRQKNLYSYKKCSWCNELFQTCDSGYDYYCCQRCYQDAKR